MLLSVVLLASCGSNEPESEATGNDLPENYEKYQSWYDTLFDTSWKLESSKWYYASGEITDHMSDSYRYYKYQPLILTLSSTLSSSYNLLYISALPGEGRWSISNDGELILLSSYHFGYHDQISLTEQAEVTNFFPAGGKITFCSSTKLELESSYDDGSTFKCVFSRVYGYTPDDDGGNGGHNNYERPDIGLEDYTCATTSITLKYRIYNQEEAQVTSATGYYGTSSPSRSVSATVAGSLITIRISSLSKGTTYYVKCTAKGKGGSTTSETTRLSTLY